MMDLSEREILSDLNVRKMAWLKHNTVLTTTANFDAMQAASIEATA